MREMTKICCDSVKKMVAKDLVNQVNPVETVSALRRLLSVAVQQTAQSKIVARFLLALHDSERFRFKLMDLRVLEKRLFRDCMSVLELAHETLQSFLSQKNSGQPIWETLAINCNSDRLATPFKSDLRIKQRIIV